MTEGGDWILMIYIHGSSQLRKATCEERTPAAWQVSRRFGLTLEGITSFGEREYDSDSLFHSCLDYGEKQITRTQKID